jgi:competence protein ComEA
MKKLLLVLAMWLAMVGAALAQININTATKEQLDGLKGIGPTKAQAIIDYRTKNGPFKTVDDLEKVNGIGPATMKDIRNDIAVTGGAAPAKAAKGEKAADKAAKKNEAKEPAKVDAKKTDKAADKADKKAEAKKDDKADAKKAKKDDKGDKAAKKEEPKKDEPKKDEPKGDKK